jgi:Asp-tRNA(Asn)/Glu-tRNA(Gln) amidotransferase A subunit family amidase
MARGLADCASFHDVLADPADVPLRSTRRIGIVTGLEATYGPDGADALEAALAGLRAAGWSVEGVDIPLWASAWEIESMLLATSVPYFVRTGWQGRWTAGTEPAIPWDARPTQLVALWMLAAEALGERANHYYHLAATQRAALRRQTATAFSRVDLVVTPTTPTPPPRRAPLRADSMLATTSGAATPVPTSTLTTPANLTGIPALAVPFGTTGGGLPRSVQFHAAMGEDQLLFRAATEIAG